MRGFGVQRFSGTASSRAAVPRGNPDSAVGSELHGDISLELAGYSVVSFT